MIRNRNTFSTDFSVKKNIFLDVWANSDF